MIERSKVNERLQSVDCENEVMVSLYDNGETELITKT
jgi:hypothetical protein